MNTHRRSGSKNECSGFLDPGDKTSRSRVELALVPLVERGPSDGGGLVRKGEGPLRQSLSRCQCCEDMEGRF